MQLLALLQRWERYIIKLYTTFCKQDPLLAF